MTSSSTAEKYTVTEYGKQNMFGAEVAPWVDQNDNYEGYPENAEKTNGRWAMIGIVLINPRLCLGSKHILLAIFSCCVFVSS